MKNSKLIFFISLMVLMYQNPLKAQSDTTSGIYVDGMFVNKIDCWTFDYMYFVFPITEKYKNFDHVILFFTVSYHDDFAYEAPKKPIVYIFQQEFSKEKFNKNFGDAKFGVWKFLRDKTTDRRGTARIEQGGKQISELVWFKRNDFAAQTKMKSGKYEGFKTSNYVVYCDVIGFEEDSTLNTPTNSKRVYIYSTPNIPVSNCVECPWDINAPCPVTGKKVDLKIEKSLTNLDHLGIIK